MIETVECDKHGTSVATCVCLHIVETLSDEKPRGFDLVVDDEGGYQANCSSCGMLSDEEWDRTAFDRLRILCLGCFRDAAGINGIHSLESH